MKANFHTHSTFSDGKSTPEEIILSAIEKGFDVLGFSDHSLFPFSRSWHIPAGNHQAYVDEIRSLAKKYSDKIEIRCGFEADYFPGVSVPNKKTYEPLAPDYLIGAVHYVVSDKGHYSVDNKTDKVRDNLIRLYGKEGKGLEAVDARKVVGEYFAAEREMLAKGEFQIIAHPDLIRLRNSELHYFDENESWYRKELKATAKAIAKAGVIAEINTGAIGRGLMQSCYPSDEFLKLLFDSGVPVCIGSDAHHADKLDCAFDKAWQAAQLAGYKELTYI